MEAIINFWNFLKTFLIVKLGRVSTVIDHRMRRRSIANIDESQFYLNSLKEDGEGDHPLINHLTAIPKPGIYLSWTDAATNGCLLGQNDDGPGLYY